MALSPINSINPFNKPFGMNVASGSAVRPIGQESIFGQGQNGQGAQAIDRNFSIFGGDTKVGGVSGVNPFTGVNTTSPTAGVVPAHAKENYRNGLAPSDDLQNVYAGTYKGKPNFLNQIAIA